jgi:Ran GTPase-activating protein (RanGAP) involved in mRNA processing and transport
VRSTFATQDFKKACDRLDHVHIARNRFNDDTGDFFAMLFKRSFHTLDVVVVEHDGVRHKLGWDARRSRVAKRQES